MVDLVSLKCRNWTRELTFSTYLTPLVLVHCWYRTWAGSRKYELRPPPRTSTRRI